MGLTFGRASEEYELGRPDWPDEAVALPARELGLDRSAVVLDLGAGTGKLTRVLTGHFESVVAVDPLSDMRALLAKALPDVDALPGTAEAIPLAAKSVEAVFIAEAFHWFDGRQALDEIARVLKPSGGLVLMWNVPAGPTEPPLPDALMQAVNSRIAAAGGAGGPRYASGKWREAFADAPFEELHEAALTNEHVVDRKGKVAGALSISALAALSAGERSALAAEMMDLLPDVEYRQPLRVELFWTRLLD
jgi:SAM-dependent methyltransferase